MVKSLKEEREARIKALRESRKPIGVCEDGRCVVTCMGVHKIVGMKKEGHVLTLEVKCKDDLPNHYFKICSECFENLRELIKNDRKGISS